MFSHFQFPYDALYLLCMDFRQTLERRIESKRKEIADLEIKLREMFAYVRGLEDTLRLIDGEQEAVETNGRGTRADSDVGKAQSAIKKAGAPLHISDLLKAIGKPDDKRNRTSLVGTLGGYARRSHVFTRTGPNTFGLLEFVTAESKSEPPDDFGVAEDGSITDDDVPF
jgi:hypothetical protein